jgi:hypothetical protein
MTQQIRQHLAGLAAADQFEIEELRRATADLKLRQLWSLMTSAYLFEDEAVRELAVDEVRRRWLLIHQNLRG